MAVDIDLAKKRFSQADDFETPQREREKEDLAFYEGVGQWPAEYVQMRKGSPATATTPAIPSRPCLTINKVKDPIRHVENEYLQADLGVSVIPSDDFPDQHIDENEIELREGLIRRIQRESDAVDAQAWAASRAIIAGRGYFGLMTRDVPGPTFDQEIEYRRFYNQFSVLLDPAHEKADGSDAEWAFVGTNVPWHTYKAEYPRLADGKRNPIISDTGDPSDSEWRALGDDAPGWFNTDDDKTKTVRVVEYWYYERDTVEYVLLDGGSIVEASTLDKETLKAIPKDRKKHDIVKTVKFAKLDGVNVLDESDWPGKFIPIVKIVGEEMQPFDNQRREEGMVRASLDSQRAFNFMISSAVELIGLAPKAPFLGIAGQFEGFEDPWNQSSVRPIGRLEYNAVTPATGGQVLPPPQRQTAEPPIQAMSHMIGQFDEAIKSTTGIPDPTLGNVDPNARSGKAIRAMLEQALRGTSNYMSNAVKSAHYAGLIVNDLLEPIYNRPGRIARIMSGTDDTSTVMLHQPFITGTGGRPVAHDPKNPDHQGQEPKTYTLTKGGSFNVAIKVSKMYDTRREQEAAQLAELIQAQPELMLWFGDLFFKNQDTPGHQELADRAKVMLAPPIQKLLASGQADDPRIAQMQQQMELMQAELQKQMADKGAKIETAQIKAQSDAQNKQVDAQVKLQTTQMQEQAANERAALDREVKLAVAELGAKIERMSLFLEERARLGAQSHEAAMAGDEYDHEAAMAGVEHGLSKDAAEQAHAHALQQTAHEAALQPEPAEA